MEIQVQDLEQAYTFSHGGVFSKVLVRTSKCDHTLFCMAAGTSISEHTSTREAAITVLKGEGVCTLAGREEAMRPGTFIFMPANTPHALRAEKDLAFLLSLSF
ncbi:MAG: cupin domain-containing protein [Clostridia bacterium]|nr:MAG: cupin domain-containing protein [Clostridia bacterium]